MKKTLMLCLMIGIGGCSHFGTNHIPIEEKVWKIEGFYGGFEPPKSYVLEQFRMKAKGLCKNDFVIIKEIEEPTNLMPGETGLVWHVKCLYNQP